MASNKTTRLLTVYNPAFHNLSTHRILENRLVRKPRAIIRQSPRLFFVGLALLLILSWFDSAAADTVVTNPINENTVWDVSGSPLIIPDGLVINSPFTLTILPGAIVSSSFLFELPTITVDGQLNASQLVPGTN